MEEIKDRVINLEEGFKEIWKLFKETDKFLREKFKETDNQINKLANLFTTQWGKLVGAIIEPGVINLFKKRGIEVRRTIRRAEVEDENGQKIAEFDIILENDNEAVVLEVKTTVKTEDVKEFIEKLKKFKYYFPKYKDMKIYGGIGGITFEEGVDKFAYREGLFVLKSEGGIIKIANDEKFKPKEW